MGRKWKIRAYREGDEEGIFELDKSVHPSLERNRDQWMRWWRWMYKENPAGNGRIWLADHDGKIVGQYAIIPVVMKIVSETITGSQSLDTVTHPDYRRQGMFETLAKEVYREAARDSIHIVYGFPNEFSYPGFIKKLGWFDVAAMQTMVKPLNWGNALKTRVNNKLLLKLCAIGGSLLDKTIYSAKKTPVMEGLTVTQISSFDERINEFWAKVSTQYQIMVVRNKDYLNWRYVTVPDVDYTIYVAEKAREIYGYLVLRCMQREQAKLGVIFDILAQSEQVAQYLISKVLQHCRQEKVDLVYSSIIANKTHLNAIRKNGFISMPSVKGERFCGYSSSPHISKEFLEDPQNWLVQIGDSDRV